MMDKKTLTVFVTALFTICLCLYDSRSNAICKLQQLLTQEKDPVKYAFCAMVKARMLAVNDADYLEVRQSILGLVKHGEG